MKLVDYGHTTNMLTGEIHWQRRIKFDRPVRELRELVQARRDERPTCANCPKPVHPRTGIKYPFYHSPWDDEPLMVNFCTTECMDEWEESGVFYCDSCERNIAETHGHMTYYRVGDGYMTCLRCYEEEILANGQPEEDFAGSKIGGGMFFNHGNPEPLAAGYEVLQDHYFVDSAEDAKYYNTLARAFIYDGWQLITGYESLSTFGDEGYITLMGKKKGRREQSVRREQWLG